MSVRHRWTARVALLVTVALAEVPASGRHQAGGNIIRIWKIGSPHQGDIPIATVPAALAREAAQRGFDLAVEVFPAAGFAALFFDAFARNAAPDLIVFDNFGVIEGITTHLGTFQGIGANPSVQRDLIRVTGAFDDLLPPQRGWTYLVASSPNHAAARKMGLRAPKCPAATSDSPRELVGIAPGIATAYLENDEIALQPWLDAERITGPRAKNDPIDAGDVRACATWGNQKLAFVSVVASYEAQEVAGHTSLLLVLRKSSSEWRVLAVARDPVSNGEFVKEIGWLDRLLQRGDSTIAFPAPAILVSPPSGRYPAPRPGSRFGSFGWRSSQSSDVVAEIAEFSYHDDVRLFLQRANKPGSRLEVDAGRLWTTRSMWRWRVWSVSKTGDLAFSEMRTFPH